jgi:hypothetical protein
MAQTKHTRILTDEQFATSTTVDGSRIDRAMEDTIARFNDLEPADLKTRFIPVEYVMGWMPEDTANAALFDFTITDDGSGYLVPLGNCPTSTTTPVAPPGSGMTLDISVDGSGNINGATVNTAGAGYSAGDTVSPERQNPGGLVGGTGYVSAGTGVATTSSAGGTGMTVDYTVAAGAVTAITAIRNCGSGYTNGDTQTIQAGNSDATFVITILAGAATLTLASQYKHHWPWVGTFNRDGEVATGSSTPTAYLNPFRIKGTLTPGIINKVFGSEWPFGSQVGWTTELFFGRPVLLDSLQLCLCLDNSGSSNKPFEAAAGQSYDWVRNYSPAGGIINMPHTDLQIVVQVADTFDERIRAKDAAEIQRHGFNINSDDFSWQAPAATPGAGNTYNDMNPVTYPGGTIRGSVIQLNELNIPIHMNAIMRVSVVLPIYDDTTAAWWGAQPWAMQYITMVAGVLEEIE